MSHLELSKNMFFLKRVLHNSLRFNLIIRNIARWYPDAEYQQSQSGVFEDVGEIAKNWKQYPHSRHIPPDELKLVNTVVNFGPAHPAAHGVLRLILELEGEIVRNITPHVGFLHRGTEKLMEHKTYLQALPYLDRLDYVSAMSNEHTYCLAVEKLLNVEVPRRAKFIRTLFAEVTRLLNHILNVTGMLLDCGAITPIFWCFEEREKLMELYERVSGARLHPGYFRPGGVMEDIPIGLLDDIHHHISRFGEKLDEIEDVVTTNRIFRLRTEHIGQFSAADAMNMGFTGTMLRSTGVKFDIRKAFPYEIYDELDFDVPIGINGDIYDRYLCRLSEMRQSLKIMEQCINLMPPGEVKVDDMKISPPKKMHMQQSMEAIIHHFKLFSSGFQVPPGCTFARTEHPKGEHGVYLVSDGSSKPYRCKMRSPSYAHLSGVPHVMKNCFLADLVAMIGSIDVVLGDVDR